ncbi:MAG TPA: GNAT family N-acetyltransferase [Salinivirgaceae bacterium]|nr:GNAT family N-acetyltransferase [Salinivirgaceae bacterium]
MKFEEQFTIVDFNPDDFQEIRALWVDLGIETPERGDSLEVIQRTLEHGGRLLVLRKTDDNAIVGTSWISNDGRRLYLHHFAIAREFQRKGLGKRLLIDTLKYAKELNMQVKLEVGINNTPAIALYTKFGFKPLDGYMVYMIRDVKNLQL